MPMSIAGLGPRPRPIAASKDQWSCHRSTRVPRRTSPPLPGALLGGSNALRALIQTGAAIVRGRRSCRAATCSSRAEQRGHGHGCAAAGQRLDKKKPAAAATRSEHEATHAPATAAHGSNGNGATAYRTGPTGRRDARGSCGRSQRGMVTLDAHASGRCGGAGASQRPAAVSAPAASARCDSSVTANLARQGSTQRLATQASASGDSVASRKTHRRSHRARRAPSVRHTDACEGANTAKSPMRISGGGGAKHLATVPRMLRLSRASHPGDIPEPERPRCSACQFLIAMQQAARAAFVPWTVSTAFWPKRRPRPIPAGAGAQGGRAPRHALGFLCERGGGSSAATSTRCLAAAPCRCPYACRNVDMAGRPPRRQRSAIQHRQRIGRRRLFVLRTQRQRRDERNAPCDVRSRDRPSRPSSSLRVARSCSACGERIARRPTPPFCISGCFSPRRLRALARQLLHATAPRAPRWRMRAARLRSVRRLCRLRARERRGRASSASRPSRAQPSTAYLRGHDRRLACR